MGSLSALATGLPRFGLTELMSRALFMSGLPTLAAGLPRFG